MEVTVMIATSYEIRKIGHGLKHNTEQYKIIGITTYGQCKYWIVDETHNQYCIHVLVADRPTWKKYIDFAYQNIYHKQFKTNNIIDN